MVGSQTVRLSVRTTQGDAYEVRVQSDAIRIGRRAGCDLRIPHPTVSLEHARLEQQDGCWYVCDGGSTNGTAVNGVRLATSERVQIEDGAVLDVGDFRITLKFAASDTEALDNTRTESTEALARRMVEQALAAVGATAPAPSLEIVSGAGRGTRLLLDVARADNAWTIGRAASCDLVLDDVDASREHVRVRRYLTSVLVADLGSKNGIYIGSRRVEDERRLHDGDELVVGATRIQFRDPAEAYLRDLESVPDRQSAGPQGPPPETTGTPARAWLDWALLAVGVAAFATAAIFLSHWFSG